MDEKLKEAIRAANRKENERRTTEWQAWVGRQMDVIRLQEADIKSKTARIANVRAELLACQQPNLLDENDGITD